MQKFSLLIPTYNRLDLLSDLIRSIQKYTDEDIFEGVILDNSMGKLHPPADLNLKNFRWINMEKNLGNLAVNYGIEWTNYDMIVQLNDDVIITDDNWLEKLYSYFTDSSIGIVGPEISRVRVQGNTFVPAGNSDIDDLYAYAESWCIMFEKKKFLEVDGMNSDIKIVYGGDFDLNMRFKRAGYFIVKAENIPIKHLRFGSTDKQKKYDKNKLCADNLRILYKYWVENYRKN